LEFTMALQPVKRYHMFTSMYVRVHSETVAFPFSLAGLIHHPLGGTLILRHWLNYPSVYDLIDIDLIR